MDGRVLEGGRCIQSFISLEKGGELKAKPNSSFLCSCFWAPSPTFPKPCHCLVPGWEVPRQEVCAVILNPRLWPGLGWRWWPLVKWSPNPFSVAYGKWPAPPLNAVADLGWEPNISEPLLLHLPNGAQFTDRKESYCVNMAVYLKFLLCAKDASLQLMVVLPECFSLECR